MPPLAASRASFRIIMAYRAWQGRDDPMMRKRQARYAYNPNPSIAEQFESVPRREALGASFCAGLKFATEPKSSPSLSSAEAHRLANTLAGRPRTAAWISGSKSMLQFRVNASETRPVCSQATRPALG